MDKSEKAENHENVTTTLPKEVIDAAGQPEDVGDNIEMHLSSVEIGIFDLLTASIHQVLLTSIRARSKDVWAVNLLFVQLDKKQACRDATRAEQTTVSRPMGDSLSGTEKLLSMGCLVRVL